MKDVVRLIKVHLINLMNYFVHQIANAIVEGVKFKDSAHRKDGKWIPE
ncbi:MAG: hypothetical protein QXU18_15600 [Thermoplasmatales archaeon]